MESYGLIVDAAVGVLVVVSAYLAMVRGFIREMFALASWVIAFFAALFLAPFLKPVLIGLPVIGELLRTCEIQAFVSFIIVFGLALIAAGLIFYMLSGPTTSTSGSVIDQGLGFMYGALRGLVLVAVVYIAYVKIAEHQDGSGSVAESLASRAPLPSISADSPIGDAYSIKLVQPVADFIWARTPTEMPDFLKRRAEELTGNCETE